MTEIAVIPDKRSTPKGQVSKKIDKISKYTTAAFPIHPT